MSASLGVVALSSAKSNLQPTLDLRTSTLSRDDVEPRPLMRSQVHLLTVLAGAGEAGLSNHDIEALTVDVDVIDAAADAGPEIWSGRTKDRGDLAAARALRVRVLIARLNPLLKTFSLRIASPEGVGRYQLLDEAGNPRTVHLRGALWSLLGREGAPPPPPGFTGTQTVLWRALAESAPYPLTVRQLAVVLAKPVDDRGLKQVTDAMARLRRKLAQPDIGWRLIRPERGVYALLPQLSALPSELL